MDFYALQLSPNKNDKDEKRKERLEKIREHVVTKEELLEELGVKTKQQKNTQDDYEKKVEGEDATLIRSDHVEPTQEEIPIQEKTPTATDKAPTEQEVEDINNVFVVASEKSNGKKGQAIKSQAPIWGVEKHEKSEPKENKESLNIQKKEDSAKSKQADLVDSKSVLEDASLKTKKENIRIPLSSGENVFDEKKLISDMTKSLIAFDENKIKDSISKLVAYRMHDPQRAASASEVNAKLKENIIGSIPAIFAYKGSKAILYTLQLLDELNLDFKYQDFEKLPADVLQSSEFKNICQKYLLWFAKEYSQNPGGLQDRIYCFNRCGVVSYEEIKGFKSLQLAILTDLVHFIKQNVDDPHDVERKVFEFALAGLLNEGEIRKMPKIKSILMRYVHNLISVKKNKPLEIAKKIDKYEKMGFIAGAEILADEKISKFIERYLLKYKKENQTHPRKVSSLVREYFDAGLINKKTRDRII